MPEASEAKQPAVAAPAAGVKKNKQMMTYGIIGIIVIAIIAVIAAGIYRAYAKSDTDGFTVSVARVLNLPAIKVDDTIVSYKDYAEDLQAIHAIKAYDATHMDPQGNPGPGATLTEQQMTDQVVIRLTNNVLTYEIAKQQGITVSSTEVSDFVNQVLLQQFGGDKTAAEKTLKERYGWTLDQYETKFIYPYLLQSKITDKISADPTARAAVKAKAQAILNAIKGGADFATMAAKYSQDSSAQNGGELGWFGKGEMVPQFEAAVFNLKKGQLDQDLVESQYGYHVVQLEDTRVTKDKDANGKTVSSPEVKARQILITYPDVNYLLAPALEAASTHLYVAAHNPFPDLVKSLQAADAPISTSTAS